MIWCVCLAFCHAHSLVEGVVTLHVHFCSLFVDYIATIHLEQWVTLVTYDPAVHLLIPFLCNLSQSSSLSPISPHN